MNETALALPDITSAKLPMAYERAKTALATCSSIDECWEWADKMAALASYAKQSEDETLLKLVMRIKARAVRRCGELLKTFNKGVGRPENSILVDTISSQRQAAEQAGLSKGQEVDAVRVANVPLEDFEAVVESDSPPTISQLAAAGTVPRPPGFARATFAIGTLSRFAQFCKQNDALLLAAAVMPHEYEGVQRDVAVIDQWLDLFITHVGDQQ